MTIQWSEKTPITCQTTKKQKGSYLTVRIKNKIFPKAFLSWKQDQMRSDWTNVERFVDLFIKMDDLRLSDFREMRLKSKVEIDIAYSAVMGNDFDAYLGETYSFLATGLAASIFKADGWYISHLRNFTALTGSSALLRNTTILQLITPYILFQ